MGGGGLKVNGWFLHGRIMNLIHIQSWYLFPVFYILGRNGAGMTGMSRGTEYSILHEILQNISKNW